MSYYSHQFLTEFFEMYQQFTCLWKVKSSEYYNRELKNQAITALVEKFKEVEKSATEAFVKKKINNYRTSYKRERNLIQSSKKNGAGVEKVYKPKLWYYNLLSFLDDQDLPQPSTSVFIKDEETNENQDTNQVQVFDYDDDDDDYLPMQTINKDNLHENRPISRQTSSSSGKKTPPIPRKRSKKSDVTETLLETIYTRILPKEKDRYDVFAENVAVKLRFLPIYQRLIAEKLINDVLYEAEFENLDRTWTIKQEPKPH